jgi:hypothetical protein
MKKFKETAAKAKDHVKAHQGTYIWGGIAIAVILLQQRNLKSFYAFLESEGIDPMKYYNPEYYAELNN